MAKQRTIGRLRFDTKTGGVMDGTIDIPKRRTVRAFLNTAPMQTTKSPDWILYAEGGKIGALWEKTSKNGLVFLSGNLDAPKTNLVAFRARHDPDMWEIFESTS